MVGQNGEVYSRPLSRSDFPTGIRPAPSAAAAEAGEEQFCNAMDGDSPGALKRQLSRLQKKAKQKTLF